MKRRIALIIAVLAAATAVIAQNLPTVFVRTYIYGGQTAGSSTNAPTVVTTNINYLFRAYLEISNTNASGTVNVYAGTDTNKLVMVLTNGQSWVQHYPIIDSGSFSCRSSISNPVGVVVSERWGQ